MDDLCYYCDGTGERDFLSGAKCYECNGTGWIEEKPELSDEERDQLDEFYDREAEYDIDDGRWQYPNGSPP